MITIITPCSRPENLERMEMQDHYFNRFNWMVCFDTSKVTEFTQPNAACYGISGGVSGNLQRNKMLDNFHVNDEFVYCLDDDNMLHPDFPMVTQFLTSDVDIITFAQELEDGTIRAGNDPRVGYIDQAQFLIRKSIHEPYEQDYNADGILISKLIAKYPERWLYVPKVLSYYNRLRWNK